jgi:hypothetical protein
MRQSGSLLPAATAIAVGLRVSAVAANPFDCGVAYYTLWRNFLMEENAIPPEQLVALSRRALRLYDACETGDLGAMQARFLKSCRPHSTRTCDYFNP